MKMTTARDRDGTISGCSDGKKFEGYVQIRDAKGYLMMDGQFASGEMDGVWKVYDPKGRVVKKPLFEKGKMISDDSMTDEEAGGSDDD